METLIHIVTTNMFIQFFGVGFLGSLFFDLTLVFNESVHSTARKERLITNRRFTIVYLICQSIYSGAFGGILAVFVNHALWLSFAIGFFNSLLISFVVKSFILNSTKAAFWVTIGRIVYFVIGRPLKELSAILEAFNTKTKDNEKDEK